MQVAEFSGVWGGIFHLRRTLIEATSLHSAMALRTRTATIATPTEAEIQPMMLTKITHACSVSPHWSRPNANPINPPQMLATITAEKAKDRANTEGRALGTSKLCGR